jgi:hypothetical protein
LVLVAAPWIIDEGAQPIKPGVHITEEQKKEPLGVEDNGVALT